MKKIVLVIVVLVGVAVIPDLIKMERDHALKKLTSSLPNIRPLAVSKNTLKIAPIAVPVEPRMMHPWSFLGSRFDYADPKKIEAEKERLKAYKFEDVEMTFINIDKSAYFKCDGKVYIILTNGGNSSGSFLPIRYGKSIQTLTINGQKVTSKNHTNEIIKSVPNPNDRFAAMSGVITAIEIPGLSPKGLKFIGNTHCIGSNGVYNLQNKIEGADPATFGLFDFRHPYAYSKDKDHMYLYNKIIDKVNPNTVNLKKENGFDYLIDDKNVFTSRGEHVPGADIETYKALSYSYQADKDYIYHRGKRLEADVDRFKISQKNQHWAYDDKYVYFQGTLMKDFEAKSFEVMDNSYIRDKDTVYNSWQKLEGVDMKTFETMPDPMYGPNGRLDAKDKHGYFSRGIRVKGKLKNIQEYKWPNGKLQSQTHYKNGIKDGLHTAWWEDGTLGEKTNYKNGKKHGSEKRWNKDGKPEREYLYKNGVKHTSRDWHKNGQLRHESHGTGGNDHQGESVTWFEDGKVDSIRVWEDNKNHGIFRRRYHKNQKITEEGTYVNGRRRGIYCDYDSDTGALEEMVFIEKNGKGTKVYGYQIDIRSQYVTEIAELRRALDVFEKRYEGR